MQEGVHEVYRYWLSFHLFLLKVTDKTNKWKNLACGDGGEQHCWFVARGAPWENIF